MRERVGKREETAWFFRTEQTVVYFPLFVCLLSVNRGHSISLLLFLLFYLVLSIYHPIESPVSDNQQQQEQEQEKEDGE